MEELCIPRVIFLLPICHTLSFYTKKVQYEQIFNLKIYWQAPWAHVGLFLWEALSFGVWVIACCPCCFVNFNFFCGGLKTKNDEESTKIIEEFDILGYLSLQNKWPLWPSG